MATAGGGAPQAERVVAPASRDLRVDALVYLAYAAFAAILLLGGTTFFTYRTWAGFAAPTYLLATALSLLVAQRSRAPGRARAGIQAMTAAGALLLPTGALVGSWAAGQAGAVHPEVVAVARAAARLVAGEFPYLDDAGGALDAYDYTPYLPAMILFGLPRAVLGPAPYTDPRVVFAAVATAAVVAAAVLAGQGSVTPRAVQLAALGPLTALPLCSGGHDLPVVAGTVLGLVLLAPAGRPGGPPARPVLAGIVLGLTVAMKVTAVVPVVLAVAMFLTLRRPRTALAFAGAAAGTAALTVLPFLLVDAEALVRNVLLHPAGLESARLLATTPFPGVLLAESGVLGRAGGVALLAVVAAALLVGIARRPPREVRAVLEWSALCLLAAILLAPSSRAGYLLYPLVLIVVARTAGPWRRGADGSGSDRLAGRRGQGDATCRNPSSSAG